MMRGETKKLTRGLEDISPIFSAPDRPAVKRPAEVQVMSVSSPNDDGDSLLLNTYFASRLASADKPCSLISLLSRTTNVCPWQASIKKAEPFGQNIKRHSLFWDELKDILEGGAGQGERITRDRDVFLDFENRHLLHYPKLFMLLDKWVVLMKPVPESLTEGYKMIKAGLQLNPFMECFVLLESKANPPADSTVFEKFAELASRNLNANLGWLGWLNLSDPDGFFLARLNMDQLRYQTASVKMSLEKLVLTRWLEANEPSAEVLSSMEGGDL